MSNLEGKRVLVTGAARGIGLAIAKEFARRGAVVTGTDLGSSAEMPDDPSIAYVQADVRDPEAMASAVARASESGGLDVCVANAGFGAELVPFEDVDPGAWAKTMDVNVVGTLVTFQAAARQMMTQSRGGVLMAIASVAGMRAEPDCPAYCASKAGTISLVESLAIYLGRHGIRVNAIAPGQTDTPGQRAVMQKRSQRVTPPSLAEATHDEVRTARRPLQRMAQPEDIARLAVFLASEEARHVNGATIALDGGDRLV